MAYKKPGIILFFTASFNPTPQEAAYAETLHGTIRFRNRAYVIPTEAVEDADAIAGFVIPDVYSQAVTKEGARRYRVLPPPEGLEADSVIEGPSFDAPAPIVPPVPGRPAPGAAPGKPATPGKPANWNPNTPPA